MKKFSIIWHSRAGHGAVTASQFISDAAAEFGFFVQSFPNFGAEKRGAPVEVFNRFSKERLEDPAFVRKADLVILLDPTLIGKEISYEKILNNVKEDGIILINTKKKTPSKFSTKFNGQIFHLDATKIANETIGRNIPNVAAVGGITRIIGFDIPQTKKLLQENLKAAFSEKIVEKNCLAFDRGVAEIFEMETPNSNLSETNSVSKKNFSQKNAPQGAIIANTGNSENYHTGNWTPKKLNFIPENCINCGMCWANCPDDAIIYENEKMVGVNCDVCKNCAMCVKACPTTKNPDITKHALRMEDELREDF
jgi:pyruvate ferredoxin oxidoreductase gamma subunit